MPEHLRALVFILAMAVPAFLVSRPVLTPGVMTAEDFDRRRWFWLALTSSAFLAHNFWLFTLLFGAALLGKRAEEWNPLAPFLMLTIAIPKISVMIPGVGGIVSLFGVDHVRVLSICLLLPAGIHLSRRPGMPRFGSLLPDRILLAFLLLDFLLSLSHRTLTGVIRETALYGVTDVLLPYFVASRSLRSIRAFRDVMASFAVGAAILSAVLVLEFARGWLLYASLDEALGVGTPGADFYLRREGRLRGQGSIGQPIAAGYVVAIAFCFILYLQRHIAPRGRWLAPAVMVAGLIGTLSRAPWLQAAFSLVLYRAFGPTPVRDLARLGIGGLVAVLALFATGKIDAVIDYLPWVGTVEASTVEFRSTLAETTMAVFLDNPLLGRFDYLEDPRIEALRGGDGLIDITNTYAQIALPMGLVGLALFVAYFGVILVGLYRATFARTLRDADLRALGSALLASLVGILLLIFTCSSIFVVPVIYWSVAGMCVAYSRLARSSVSSTSRSPRTPASGTARRAPFHASSTPRSMSMSMQVPRNSSAAVRSSTVRSRNDSPSR
jgi:hypothetical protein